MKGLTKDYTSAVDVFAVLVVILMFITAGLGIVLYQISTKEPHTSPTIVAVEEEDLVNFEYVALFEDNQKVFEINNYSKAVDNETYPKDVAFLWPENGKFEPVNFTVGFGLPGENFTGMIDHGKAIEDELIGMQQGATKTFTLDPDEAFGFPDTSKIRTLNLTETLVQIETMSSVEFLERFEGIELIFNATFNDPIWGWEVRVVDIKYVGDESEVTIRHLPEAPLTIWPYKAFPSEVTKVDSAANEGKGEITVKHLVNAGHIGSVLAQTPSGDRFKVVGLNEAEGTYEADFNSPKTGRRLVYQVTIVSIQKQ